MSENVGKAVVEMETRSESPPAVNMSDHRQDVFGTRRVSEGRGRYRFAEMLVPPDGQGARLLDIGGGMAEFSRRCAAMGYRITLADLSPNNVANARNLGFQSHQIDFNRGLPGIDDNQFEVTVMLDVIEHVVNAERLLEEVWRVLVPGGILVLSTPNCAFWRRRLDSLLGDTPTDEGYHYRFFTRRTLGEKLRAARLSPESWRFSSPAFGVNKVRRMLARKSRMHFVVPGWLGPFLGQTMFVKARARK